MNERAGIDRLARAVDEVAATLPVRARPPRRTAPRRGIRYALAASLALALALAGFLAWRARPDRTTVPSDVRVVYLRINGRDASPRVWEPRRAGAVLVAPRTASGIVGQSRSTTTLATIAVPTEGVPR